jgi:hypothetical protein
MASETVRMVLVEGDAAGGVTVDQDGFDLAGDATPVAVADHVVAAIVGTRESAAEGGYQVTSSGVSWTDPARAAALRDALAARNIDNVLLVSAVMAAGALTQAMGSATNWARTALLLVEPISVTRAVVDTSTGTITDLQRHALPSGDDAALAKLTTLVAGAEVMRPRPDGVFLVGSDIDIPSIKPSLESATSLSVTTPEEPEMALARGASLAAANVRLGAPRTVAMSSTPTASMAAPDLAYSAATQHDSASDAHPTPAQERKRRSRKSVLTIAAVTTLCIGGLVAVALVVGIRPHADQRPDVGPNVVAPVNPPPPPNAGPPAPAPPSAVPAPHPAAPPQAPASSSPPSPQPGTHQHWDDWLHRHLGQ